MANYKKSYKFLCQFCKIQVNQNIQFKILNNHSKPIYILNRNPMPDKDPLEFKQPELYYFNVTNEVISLKNIMNPEQHRITFWDNVFDQNQQQWNTTFNFHTV